jgi:hypothetical protein
LLAQLHIDLSMCLRGCRLHLGFESWDPAYSPDANFEAICWRIDSLYGPEICQDFRNLVKILYSKEACLKCRCTSILGWNFGPPSDWSSQFLSLRDEYDAECTAPWSAVTDDLKFGFKANFGCSNAIFALPSVLLIIINCLYLFVKLVCLKIV